ncbi:MAG: type II toxin-antitoxin system HigB family toxin [Microcoleus sp. PH2017_20_SFW_D_A]|nr:MULTISPECIES: type II toxin-antitoxin system HigB family toxin [unclassified Microcoleus]MCC3505274.1 type II toxin-antitoxin system HigB family toxin [Microcoleus sp. PH2017_19_SFW_U_A]MCC3446052.1 type II toxin-antitoxin system HigB family toxin [Microcoleus sp. PH2017_09_SFU_O_A]MCC3523240.1 type II toxin-antitoxin system HigB family toxin [Microcoleus sp. PH2017_20_SFW_D_A]MCC3554518.1 type II toxin-antitoxin system HigB family toxin [Microcoleus sp. PH2017_35_SFW_U_B]MCC3627049.1 type 
MRFLRDSIVYIKYILTHAEYDKNNWKNDPYF